MKIFILVSIIFFHGKNVFAECVIKSKLNCVDVKKYRLIGNALFEYDEKKNGHIFSTNATCISDIAELNTHTNIKVNLPFCPNNRKDFYGVISSYNCGDAMEVVELENGESVSALNRVEKNNIEILYNKICDPKKEQQQLKFMQKNLVGKKVSELTKQGLFRISKKDKIWTYHAHVANSWDVEISGEMCGNEICDDETKQKIVGVKYKEDYIMLDDEGKLYYSSADAGDKRYEYRPKSPEPKKKSFLEWFGF